ncbi:MAG: hypothetical protein SV910_06480 [Chloroflexota bacterium]|nr:hypothetical protein [Chloroflexota bacterium]
MFIEITPNEAIAIDHLCKNDDLPREMFLQIGQVLLSGEPAPVSVSEGELWRLREVVPYAYTVGKEPVGLSLKHKVFQCLLDMDMEREVGIPLGSIEEPAYDKERLVERNHPDHVRKGGEQCL